MSSSVASSTAPATTKVDRRLYLLRHAEAEMVDGEGRMWSLAQKPLTNRGQAQARALSMMFKSVAFDRIYASDLRRAVDTATAIAHDRPVSPEPELREISLGDFEGAAARDVFATEPHFLSHGGAALPGGESFDEVGDRVIRLLAKTLRSDSGHDLVFVGHGAVNRALIGRLLGLESKHALQLRQDWACVNILEFGAGRWWIGMINWTPFGLDEFHLTRPSGVLSDEIWRRLGR